MSLSGDGPGRDAILATEDWRHARLSVDCRFNSRTHTCDRFRIPRDRFKTVNLHHFFIPPKATLGEVCELCDSALTFRIDSSSRVSFHLSKIHLRPKLFALDSACLGEGTNVMSFLACHSSIPRISIIEFAMGSLDSPHFLKIYKAFETCCFCQAKVTILADRVFRLNCFRLGHINFPESSRFCGGFV